MDPRKKGKVRTMYIHIMHATMHKLYVEEFMPLKGMILFELSRGRPKTMIKVAMSYYNVISKFILRALPFCLECPASSALLYHDLEVSGWHWK